MSLRSLKAEIERLKALRRTAGNPQLVRYRMDPCGYARQVLGEEPTPDQERIALALLQPPFKVTVDSAHSVGKTWAAAWLANWWYDTRPQGIVLTTAPTQRDVVDLLWSEIRRQRAKARLPSPFAGPKAPELYESENHYAKGYTARKGESFQGRHRPDMLFIFDEAEGVERPYWTTTKTMFDPGHGHAWLTIQNPVTTTSAAFLEQTGPDRKTWRRFELSALNHPNVLAGLEGRPVPIPGAVTVQQVDEWVNAWCTPVPLANVMPNLDFEWRPGSGRWWRPGPIAEPRILGRRPSQATYAVWSEFAWSACTDREPIRAFPLDDLPEIGCDVARFGDDFTAIHVRYGPCSVHHEAWNGWDTRQTAERLRELAIHWAKQRDRLRPPQAAATDPKRIRIKVDDAGAGGGVVDQAAGYLFIPVNASEAASDPAQYPNRRSELWFATVSRAHSGGLDLTRLPSEVLERLRQQAFAPTYELDTKGRLKVEPKADTKEKLGRSPDDMDAMNLAYLEVVPEVPNFGVVEQIATVQRRETRRGSVWGGRRGYGR